MDLGLDVQERDGFAVLAVSGEVDVATVPRLREQLHGLVAQGSNQIIVNLDAVDFLELAAPGGGAAIDLEEVVLAEGSPLAGLRLRDLPSRGVRVSVVAIRHAGEALRLAPGADDVLAAGDHVVVVGDRANVEKLAARAVAD